MTYITGVKVPAVSQELINTLRSVFQPYCVKPGFERDALMQSVGEQNVVDWLAHHANGRTVTGDPSVIRDTNRKGAIVKLGE